tara:strand:+ start:550 stop:732 length:183 start_codon:yes stop_codon:yes gene_type:complete
MSALQSLAAREPQLAKMIIMGLDRCTTLGIYLTGIAMRRSGITDGAYLNPLTVEDGVPDP